MLFEYEFLEANIYSWKYKKTAFPKPTFTYKIGTVFRTDKQRIFYNRISKTTWSSSKTRFPKVFHTGTIYFIYYSFFQHRGILNGISSYKNIGFIIWIAELFLFSILFTNIFKSLNYWQWLNEEILAHYFFTVFFFVNIHYFSRTQLKA